MGPRQTTFAVPPDAVGADVTPKRRPADIDGVTGAALHSPNGDHEAGYPTADGRVRADLGYRVIVMALVLVAGWLLALPLSGFVQRVALNRFHLQTGTFAGWALQAPVPAMYNFRNRFRVEAQAWDRPALNPPISGTLNHFPVRLWTFADTRGVFLEERARIRLVLESTYRGRTLTTSWTAEAAADGRIVLRDEVGP